MKLKLEFFVYNRKLFSVEHCNDLSESFQLSLRHREGKNHGNDLLLVHGALWIWEISSSFHQSKFFNCFHYFAMGWVEDWNWKICEIIINQNDVFMLDIFHKKVFSYIKHFLSLNFSECIIWSARFLLISFTVYKSRTLLRQSKSPCVSNKFDTL